ncbi:MAG: UDP-glucose/GDP-mannose dehydrogenase family protein [Mycobacteriaceae bacterium]
MRISVIGCGYLGATHAAAMAELGFEVIGVDVDEAKLEALAKGCAPFFEPELEPLLRTHVDSGRLRFTTSVAEAGELADVHFVCVGTPQRPGSHAADLTYVDAAFAELAPHLRPGAVVVGKSTVPVGTASRLSEMLTRTAGADVVLAWNPEFLREGKAVQDTLQPDRLVFGAPRDPAAAARVEQVLREVYATPISAGSPVVMTDLPTAELVKVSANAFLATKISYINAIAEVCDATGADVSVLADAIGLDVRIGRGFLNAGLGFGGGCLPKDIRAFSARAGELGVSSTVALLREVDEINMRQRQRVIDMATEQLGGSLLGQRVAVLGCAFKPETDDVRDSPALNVAAALYLKGAQVTVYDPEAVTTARKLFPTLTYANTWEQAAAGADVLLVLTEWPEFTALDPDAVGQVVGTRNVVDGRNCLDAPAWRAAGWTLACIGRP